MFIVAEWLGMTVAELRRVMPAAELALWAEFLKPKED